MTMSNLMQSMPKAPLVTFITDVQGDEPEILNEILARETLKIVSIFDRNEVFFECAAPEEGWTHEALCTVDAPQEVVKKAWDQGADAYLGKEWVGSTEV